MHPSMYASLAAVAVAVVGVWEVVLLLLVGLLAPRPQLDQRPKGLTREPEVSKVEGEGRGSRIEGDVRNCARVPVINY